jgi:hypothetical protein
MSKVMMMSMLGMIGISKGEQERVEERTLAMTRMERWARREEAGVEAEIMIKIHKAME